MDQVTYENMLAAQQEVVEANRALQSRGAALEESEQASDQAHQAYAEQPHANGLRAGVMAGAVGLGAVGGGMLGRRQFGVGTGMGAFHGGLLGLSGGLVAQPAITNHLDKKHPERVSTRLDMARADDQVEAVQRRWEAEKSLRNMTLSDATRMGHENPAMYSRAVREVGDEYPTVEAQQMLGKMRQADQQRAQHESKLEQMQLQERELSLQGAQGQNELTSEEVNKARMKNEARSSKMNQEKEAFSKMRAGLEKYAYDETQEDPYDGLAYLGGAAAGVGGYGAHKVNQSIQQAAGKAADMQPAGLPEDVLDVLRADGKRQMRGEVLRAPLESMKGAISRNPLETMIAGGIGGIAGLSGYQIAKGLREE